MYTPMCIYIYIYIYVYTHIHTYYGLRPVSVSHRYEAPLRGRLVVEAEQTMRMRTIILNPGFRLLAGNICHSEFFLRIMRPTIKTTPRGILLVVTTSSRAAFGHKVVRQGGPAEAVRGFVA